MKLQLLIPQYNETEEVMRPMLESISTQQGVDLGRGRETGCLLREQLVTQRC